MGPGRYVAFVWNCIKELFYGIAGSWRYDYSSDLKPVFSSQLFSVQVICL